MLIMKQPKKSNSNIRYSIENNPSHIAQVAGKVIKKNRPVKQKLQKNLSQLPIGLLNDSKQNSSLANIMIARPHSSLVASDISGSLSKSRQKIDLNAFCKDKIKLKKIGSKRNTLAITDTQIKGRKVSGVSNSNNKWNNRSVEQDPSLIKLMMAENRKKYNLSCGDVIQNKSKCKQTVQKGKKKSIATTTKNLNKGTSKKNIQKQSQAKAQPEVKKFKPANLANKSKGSTAVINPSQNPPKTRKQQKQNKQNKRKQRSKSRSKSKSKSKHKNKKAIKSNKMFVLRKESEDERSIQQHEYPINKYVDMKKKPKKSLNIKVGVDYNFAAINLVSASSGVIFNDEHSSSIDRNQPNQFLHILQDNQATDSINLQQIKFYQDHSPFRKKQSVLLQKNKKFRKQIQNELQQQYPYLNSAQLDFLSSVVFIQRKWRQYRLLKNLNQQKPVVSQYFMEQYEKSRERKIQKSKSSHSQRPSEKIQHISRTKLQQFEEDQQLKETVSKNRARQLDPQQYQTRKNSIKDDLIIYPNQESSERQDIHTQSQGQITDRKPVTQSNRFTVNYARILSNQVFPQVCYLQYRKNNLRQQFEQTMKVIIEEKNFRKISEKQFQFKTKEIMECYQHNISQLKKTKYDIKKGFLKYIDCMNKIKQIKNQGEISHKIDHKYGLRKVSSDSNFLSNLYQKIFKFDKCISQWSGGSQSIQILAKKILIRKQYYQNDKKSQRRSLSDLRSAARSSYQFIKSCRDPDSNTVLVFEQTDRFANVLQNSERQLNEFQNNQSKPVNQFKFSSQIFKTKQQQIRQKIHSPQINEEQQQQPSKITNKFEINNQQLIKQTIEQKQPQQQPEKDSINLFKNAIPLVKSTQSLMQKIEEQIILQLSKQLQRDIHQINPVLVDIILINQPDRSQFDHVEYQQDQDSNQQKSPAMRNLHRQLQSMGSPRNSFQQFINKIPETEPDRILDYLCGLVTYIRRKNWTYQIAYNMNNNQSFEAIAYLKFLRDFQIPQDEYIPIINNEKFIQWQNYYNNNQENQQKYSQKYKQQMQALRQSEAIFHRCIFQVFLNQLEKNRPYGQRGRPFPWQQKYTALTVRQVTVQKLPSIFQKCIHKLEQYLIYRCGIISQKLIIGNEQELERAHEQNQDRIIQMLQQDLMESSHQWYEVEEHALQIKLQLTFLIQQMLFDEITYFIH